MNPWIIFFVILIIIIIILIIVFVVFRRPFITNAVLYGQLIKIRNPLFENGLLSSCGVNDTDCSRRVYVPEFLDNLRNSETQTWRIHSDIVNDGQPIRYGDIIYLVPTFNVNLQIGLCGRISTQPNCRNTIGLRPIDVTDGTVRWQINSAPSFNIVSGNPVLFNEEVNFFNPTLERTMAACTDVRGTDTCGGLDSRVITLLTTTGINDQWILLPQ